MAGLCIGLACSFRIALEGRACPRGRDRSGRGTPSSTPGRRHRVGAALPPPSRARALSSRDRIARCGSARLCSEDPPWLARFTWARDRSVRARVARSRAASTARAACRAARACRAPACCTPTHLVLVERASRPPRAEIGSRRAWRARTGWRPAEVKALVPCLPPHRGHGTPRHGSRGDPYAVAGVRSGFARGRPRLFAPSRGVGGGGLFTALSAAESRSIDARVPSLGPGRSRSPPSWLRCRLDIDAASLDAARGVFRPPVPVASSSTGDHYSDAAGLHDDPVEFVPAPAPLRTAGVDRRHLNASCLPSPAWGDAVGATAVASGSPSRSGRVPDGRNVFSVRPPAPRASPSRRPRASVATSSPGAPGVDLARSRPHGSDEAAPGGRPCPAAAHHRLASARGRCARTVVIQSFILGTMPRSPRKTRGARTCRRSRPRRRRGRGSRAACRRRRAAATRRPRPGSAPRT